MCSLIEHIERDTRARQAEQARQYVGYSGWRAMQLMGMAWDRQDNAHRSSTMLTANDCNNMSALGHDVPISADATTRWIRQ